MPRPFLKWAGGKGQLLPDLLTRVAAAAPFERYHEPFLGGGALFFELSRRDALKKRARLSDRNPNLVDAYLGLRDDPDGIIALLRTHEAQHSKEHYYAVRSRVPSDATKRAARIIYLNRTCFNGLYRENRSGKFNVPCGAYKNPRVCDEENLRAVSRALRTASIEARSFETILDRARPGDLVYFDPPYHPISATSSFTAYSGDGFDEQAQKTLAQVFDDLDRKGVKVLLSNSMTGLVRQLYRRHRIEQVFAKRSVNSRGDRRGKICEALVRNF